MERLHAALFERVDWLRRDHDKLDNNFRLLSHAVEDLRRDLALLQRVVESLKRDRDRTGQRVWMVLAPLFAGSAGVALSY